MQATSPTIGTKFGKWEVLGEVSYKKGLPYILCRCDCGTEKDILIPNLTKGKSTQCSDCRGFRHGLSYHPAYRTWHGMIKRCYRAKGEDFRDYQGRGIKVCHEWKVDVAVFIRWAEANGFKEGLQIDRKDTNGNYEPGNCRFITVKANQRNRRDNRLLTAFGETKCVSAWGEDPRCVVSFGTFTQRVSRLKWDAEKALTTVKHGTVLSPN